MSRAEGPPIRIVVDERSSRNMTRKGIAIVQDVTSIDTINGTRVIDSRDVYRGMSKHWYDYRVKRKIRRAERIVEKLRSEQKEELPGEDYPSIAEQTPS